MTGGDRSNPIIPTSLCASFFPFFEGPLKSYIDELLGGPSPGPLAHFGPLSHGKYKQKPTKTERLKIQKISKKSPFWRPPKKEIPFCGLRKAWWAYYKALGPLGGGPGGPRGGPGGPGGGPGGPGGGPGGPGVDVDADVPEKQVTR